ncbi:iron ABC transporter permease [Nitriliruptoraceae bacterium ZYF776]|nr:iron ABC transporter permease [Profundirhabdus halotolerans]
MAPPVEDLVDDLGRDAARRRTTLWIGGLGLGLFVTLVAGIALGSVSLPLPDVARIVGHHLVGVPAEADWSVAQDSIVWRVRVPRVLLGATVGAGLAICGVALQAMVRNVLADPYLLGVTSGASTGAAGAILFGFGLAFGEHALSISAFLGAAAASLLVFTIARTAGRVTSVRLLLAGVAVGYALYAATSFLIFASPNPEGARTVLFWLLGSLSLARWSSVFLVVVLVVAVTLVTLTVLGRQLDALAIGDETAQTLGTSPTRFRAQLLVLVSLCIGAVVAISGGIGFVGLVIPHVARRFVGGAHRRLVPVAALIGAMFLVWADLFARTVIEPRELPIGILTALVGAPFLLLLVRRLHAASA